MRASTLLLGFWVGCGSAHPTGDASAGDPRARGADDAQGEGGPVLVSDARAPDPPKERDASDPGVSELRFVEIAAEAGLDYVQAPLRTELGCEDFTPVKCPFTSVHMSGGAAAADFDSDGDQDLYVTRLDAPSILYRNRGDGTFEDVTDAFGLVGPAGSNGAGFGDIDNDGDQDLYVTNLFERRFHLYVNEGDHFVEEAELRGAAIATEYRHHGFGVAFGDYDRDGYLDLHTTEWVQIALDEPAPAHARLLRNLGSVAPGFFEDVTDSAGVNLLEGVRATRTSFTSSFSDLDEDGWPELLVVADFATSRLFWNNGDGSFVEGALASGTGTDLNGMGCALGDYDSDGDIDWFVSSIFDPDYKCDGIYCGWAIDGNRLYENQGDRFFADVTDAAGVRDGGWGWGTAFFDYDNDADLDLVMTNGVDFPNDEATHFRNDPQRLYRNEGGSTFVDVAEAVGVGDRGDGRGLLVLDYDDDGDQDLFVVQHEGSPLLYRNDGGNAQAWLRVRLLGRASNRDGVGARVTVVRSNGERGVLREASGGNHFLGQSESTLHFGLGDLAGPIAELRVLWPSGRETALRQLATRSTVLVEEP